MKQAIFIAIFLFSSLHAQTFSSGTVTSHSAGSASLPSGDNWSVISGSGDILFPVVDASGNAAARITVITQPIDVGFIVEYKFTGTMDLRPFDTVSFSAQVSQTHISDYMYLVDIQSRMRWFNLRLRGSSGMQRQVYSINNFVGEHPGFDVSNVKAIRYGQYALNPGDILTLGPPIFETGIVDHCDVASTWSLDLVSSGTIDTSSDSVNGSKSIVATVTATDAGQADIAILGADMGIRWDLSNKKYVSFYFKDQDTNAIHYFLLYDKDRNYREWIFANADPGNWVKVTADLRDSGYFESAPIDLSNVEQFEVGVFGGPPRNSYTFQVDEVTVR